MLSASLAGDEINPKTDAVGVVGYGNQQLQLGVHGHLRFGNAIVRYEVFRRSDSAVILQLFSDYWIINKIGDGIMYLLFLSFTIE